MAQRTPRIKAAPAVTLVLIATFILAGCSATDSFESELEELASERDSFELPPEIGDDERWQARLIMCPYATQPDDVHPTLVEAASEIDTNSTDDSQWLLFRTDDRVTTLNLSRQQVDFCAPSVPNNETYGPDASWESVEQDQTVSVTPVKH